MHGILSQSTDILHRAKRTADVESYLKSARERGFLERITTAFAAADKLKIAFVGETIIDEYCYVKPLAKPSKEFILATVAVNGPESFFGGVVAASQQGEWPNREVVTCANYPIRKMRYVDGDFSRKLFEVYSEQTISLSQIERGEFDRAKRSAIKHADVVVVFDFGHGLICGMDCDDLGQSAFLAVNAQTNSGNSGFNPVTKYKRADYVCVDEPEARLAAEIQYGEIEDLAETIAKRMQCEFLAITRGRNGASVFDYVDVCGDKYGRIDVPAFASHGIDTIGAGDTFLAITAPLIAAGLDLETAAFVGNVAGAIKIDIVGHRRHVERDELMSTIKELLK